MKLKLLIITLYSALAAHAATLTTEMFKIDYDASDSVWTDASLQVLSRTLSYWESVLDYRPSTDAGKIYINFTWDSLDEGILGGADSEFFYSDQTTLTGTLVYTNAQSKYLLGNTPEGYDGSLVFSRNFDFHFGSGECPNTLIDFQTTLLHEIAHLMGVNSLYSEGGPEVKDGVTYLTLWDSMFSYDGNFEAGKTIIVGDPELGLTVYNPIEWEDGSSMAHISEESDPDSVMHAADDYGTMHRQFSEREFALYASMGMVTINIPEPCTTSLGIFALAALAYRRRCCA